MKRLLILVLLSLFATPVFAQSDSVLDGFRHFILPTARPIGGGYVGCWELAFLQGGVGLGELSLSGGFTAMPSVAFRSQIGYLRAKLTLFDEPNAAFAIGGNWLRLTSDYLYTHLFGILTIETNDHTRYTGALIYKAAGDDFPDPNIVPYGQFSFTYGGALGAAIAMDTPIPGFNHVRFVGEAWNHDLTNPNKLAIIGAVRLENPDFSSDFGLMFFTMPLLVPVANFVWRF